MDATTRTKYCSIPVSVLCFVHICSVHTMFCLMFLFLCLLSSLRVLLRFKCRIVCTVNRFCIDFKCVSEVVIISWIVKRHLANCVVSQILQNAGWHYNLLVSCNLNLNAYKICKSLHSNIVSVLVSIFSLAKFYYLNFVINEFWNIEVLNYCNILIIHEISISYINGHNYFHLNRHFSNH